MKRREVVIGDWVQYKHGQVGLVVGLTPRKAVVQYGSSGPFYKNWLRDLWPATKEQITEKIGRTP